MSFGSNLKLDLGLRYDYLPSPTEADNKLVAFDPATASLLQIGGTGGFTQVTKNGSDFQPRVGRHLESDRRRQDRGPRRVRDHGQPEQHRLLHR